MRIFNNLNNLNTNLIYKAQHLIIRNSKWNELTRLKLISTSNFCTSFSVEKKFEKKEQNKTLNDLEKEAIDLDDEQLDYDFFDQKYVYNSNNEFSKFVNKMKCQGCGINLQIENQEKIGYIPPKKFFDYVNKQEKNSENEAGKILDVQSEQQDKFNNKDNQQTQEDPELAEFEKVHDKATLKRILKLKNSKNILTCERCYKLKNYLNFEELNKHNNLDTKKSDKVDNYTLLVKKINPQRLIHQIMARISNKAHVFYVCVRYI